MLIFQPIWWMGYAILAVLAALLFFYAPRQNNKYYDRFKTILGWAILINQSSYWVMATIDGSLALHHSLPIHMCAMSQFLLFAILVLKQNWAFSIVVFWGPMGSFFAFLLPDPNTSNIFYILQFYFAHSAVFLIPIYLKLYGGYKIPNKIFWRTIVITNIIGFSIMGLNNIIGSNYWYVTHAPVAANHVPWLVYFLGLEFILFSSTTLILICFREKSDNKITKLRNEILVQQ